MMVMTDPVTTGGKKRSSREKNGARITVTTPADDHRAEHRGQPVRPADEDERRDGGERRALHDGQPHADLREADGLDERGHAAHEEGGVDEVDELVGRQPRSPWPRSAARRRCRRTSSSRAGARRPRACRGPGPRPPGGRRRGRWWASSRCSPHRAGRAAGTVAGAPRMSTRYRPPPTTTPMNHEKAATARRPGTSASVRRATARARRRRRPAG